MDVQYISFTRFSYFLFTGTIFVFDCIVDYSRIRNCTGIQVPEIKRDLKQIVLESEAQMKHFKLSIQ